MEAEGLSIKWKKKLNESLKFSNEKELDDMKIGLVNLLDSISLSLLSYQETILIILAAKSDLNGGVAKVGEDVMRRIDKVKINLEDPIVSFLFFIFLLYPSLLIFYYYSPFLVNCYHYINFIIR